MSRILRRPMFRGGQVIDSRGTGITSGLMDGGRVGYQSGNIVLGSDLLSKASMPTNLSDLNKLKFSAASPLIFTGAANQTTKEKVEDEVEKPSDVMEGSVIDKVSDSKTLTEDLGDPLGSDFDTTEIIDGNYSGEEITVAFNPDYLIDGLEVIGTEEVSLETTDALKPAILKGLDEETFLYLLMPVRVS